MYDVLHDDMLYLRGKNAILFVYNQKKKTAYIPNEEIRGEFADAVSENKWNE